MPKVYSRGTFSFLLPTLFHRIDHFVAQKTKGGSVIGVKLENPRDENGWASGGIAGYAWKSHIQTHPIDGYVLAMQKVMSHKLRRQTGSLT